MAADDTKRLVLHSSFEEMEKLQPFVDTLQQWTACSDDQSSRIMLTLSEAVNNAIIHGNRQQYDQTITITAVFDDDRLTLSVADQGSGFDPDDLPDPVKEENLLNEGGRGIYLIKQYADEVSFSEGGSTVTMQFQLPD